MLDGLVQCFCLQYLMENQKSSMNPLLMQTSRQFYSRRMPHRTPSNAQLDKVLTILNREQQKRTINRIKTDPKEQRAASPSGQADYLLKMARIRVENCLKKQSNEWKECYHLFDQFKRSGSIEIIKMNEANFLAKMEEVIKKNSSNRDESALEKGRSQRKNQKGKLSIEQINLIKQNKMLKQQLNTLVLKQGYPKEIEKLQQNVDSKLSSEEEKKALEKMEQLLRETQILKQGNDLLREEKKVLTQKIRQLRRNNQNLCEEILKCRNNSSDYLQKFEMWKNIMAMQNEEIISLKRDIIDFKAQFRELNKKYRNTLKRISKMNSSNPGKLEEVTQKSVDVFTQQLEFFQKVRSIFVPKGYYTIMGKDQKDQRESSSATYKKYLSDKDALANVEGIKKMNKFFYRFYRPSFFIFLQKYFQYQGVDKQNFQQININVGMHLLLTIRGIMDSKHNQYLISRYSHSAFSSLPNFTVSWLCNFKIDAKTKKKAEITTDVCFQTIGGFYARLMSSQLNGYWEVITFREFLMETLTMDELLFYLKARYKLMNGDCLEGSGTFVEVYQVNYIDALQLIQEVVGDFDYRKKLQDYIKRSVQFQRKKQIIDANFVLRLLLQYYQYSKNKIFATLSKTFFNYTRQKNTNMPFESYLKIYDYNFSELSLIDRVEIYKKAFSLGRGITNLDNIITVLNEEGYLMSEVQKMFKQKVIYEEKPEEIISTVQKPSQIQEFEEFYERFIEKDCVSELSKMGLELIKRHLQLLESPRSLNFDILFARMQFIFNFCMFRLRKLHDSKRLKDIAIFSFLPSQISFYRELTKSSIQKGAIFQIHDEFRKKCAARLILKFYRKKKGYMSRGYLSNSQYGQKPTKMQEIRKQFTNLIDNIKKKYTPGVLTQTITEYEENEEN